MEQAFGDWIGWLCLAGMVVFLALDIITARRETS